MHSLKKKSLATAVQSPKPGCSGLKRSSKSTSGATSSKKGKAVKSKKVVTSEYSEESTDEETEDDIKCCVCNSTSPVGSLWSHTVTPWVQCDKCGHWVHLKFCTEVRVVRRGDDFFCPHCIP